LITGRVIRFGVFLGCLGSIGINPAFCQDEPVLSEPVPADFKSALTPTSNEREGLIHLDVSVKDRNGDARTGLSEKEFTLLDDGAPAKILSFRAANEAGAQGDKSERLSEVVLVLDHVNLSDLQFSLVKRETIKYLRRNGGRLACPMSVYVFTIGGLYASAIATTDGNALAEDIARDRFPRSLWQIPQPRAGDINDLNGRRYLLWDKALQTIYTIAIERRDKPGRKLVVWMGFGWPVNLGTQQHGDNDFYSLVELSTRIREARMVICQVTDWPDPQEFNFAYTNYVAGIRSVSELENSGITRPFAHFALQVLAIQSGGLILDSSPDIPQGIERCIQDAGAFYTLSFDPPHTAHVDEYHDLKVDVASSGLSAHTTTGYYNQPVFYDEPRVPEKQITVHELHQMLDAAGQERDGELADELTGLELSERLSSMELADWKSRLRGKRSKTALTALADGSVFFDPPPSEIPADAAPDHEAQVQILKRTVTYLAEVMPRLPDFFATRTTVQFEQRSTENQTWKTAPADQSLREGATEVATLLYRDSHEQQIVEKRKSSRSIKKNLNFIGVFGPILYSTLRDAMSNGNGLSWSRWERGGQGTEAVFRYNARNQEPSFVVENCCFRNGAMFRARANYHGELAVDAATGAILRLTMESDPGWVVEPDLSPIRLVKITDMMVEFGEIEIGGKKYICPLRSVVVSRTRPVKPLKVWDVDLAVYAPYETLLDDIAFTNYHKFGSEARILPGFEVVPEAKPPAPGSAPPQKGAPPDR
jgi:VWFA-related protein